MHKHSNWTIQWGPTTPPLAGNCAAIDSLLVFVSTLSSEPKGNANAEYRSRQPRTGRGPRPPG